jgi:6-phosphofructokinase 2
MPHDFYSRIAEIAVRKNFKLIIDTSGEPLKKAAGEGIYLMKPSLSELTSLAGQEKISEPEQEKFAAKVISEGKTKILVISMGGRGAMLASKDGFQYFLPPTVKLESTVGAGDSMVGAMVLKLLENWPLSEVVRYGVAAGAAATMTPGSELCRAEDTEEIYLWMKGFTLTI